LLQRFSIAAPKVSTQVACDALDFGTMPENAPTLAEKPYFTNA
jgi:hypothetical protein